MRPVHVRRLDSLIALSLIKSGVDILRLNSRVLWTLFAEAGRKATEFSVTDRRRNQIAREETRRCRHQGSERFAKAVQTIANSVLRMNMQMAANVTVTPGAINRRVFLIMGVVTSSVPSLKFVSKAGEDLVRVIASASKTTTIDIFVTEHTMPSSRVVRHLDRTCLAVDRSAVVAKCNLSLLGSLGECERLKLRQESGNPSSSLIFFLRRISQGPLAVPRFRKIHWSWITLRNWSCFRARVDNHACRSKHRTRVVTMWRPHAAREESSSIHRLSEASSQHPFARPQ